jgi:L-lysine 2,3-aminomutase
MAKNTLEDPLVRQFLPLKDEEHMVEGYAFDAVQDGLFRKENRLLHKYEGRALLLTTAACAMNCRFCFRRNFDYAENENFFEQELKAIQNDPSLSEIILSGGDPLALSNEKLGVLFQKLARFLISNASASTTRFRLGPRLIDLPRDYRTLSIADLFRGPCSHRTNSAMRFSLRKASSSGFLF